MGIILIFSHQPKLLSPKPCCPQLHCLNKLHSKQAKAVAQETADMTSETHSPILWPSFLGSDAKSFAHNSICVSGHLGDHFGPTFVPPTNF